jgi:hypothetical protein
MNLVAVPNQTVDTLVNNYYSMEVPCTNTWTRITHPKISGHPIEHIFLDPNYGIVQLGMDNLANFEKELDGPLKDKFKILTVGSADLDGDIYFNFEHDRLSSDFESHRACFMTLQIAQTETFIGFNNGGQYPLDENNNDHVCPHRCTQEFYVKVNPKYPGLVQNVNVLFKVKEMLQRLV